MKSINFKAIYPHLIAVAVFLIVAVIYCKPALEGKVLQQSDITQWKAMYEDQRKVKEETGTLPLWTNGMFSGMPGYQIAMEVDNPFTIGYVFQLLTLSLPKPFYFFLLASICFYLLTQIMGINPYLGIFGGLSYAFATYHPILISAGHETKMIALGYLPAFIGGLMLIYEKKYLLGLTCTALFTGLMISANHPQISYYAIIIAFFMTAGYLIQWIKTKAFKQMFIALGISLAGGIIGVLCNIVVLATTFEYSKESIRGGSVLADEKSNNNKTGLNKDYALSYSFNINEPLVMMFPRIFGGSSGNLEVAEDESKAIEALQQMPQELGQQLQGYLQFYWGGITRGTSGPPYSGAIVCMLALLGISFIPNKHKWWMMAVTILAFMMSWGHYFETFNVFLLEHLPMYNKFRAPSMIMVIPTFVFVMCAMIAAQYILFQNEEKAHEKFKKGLYVVAAVFIFALSIYISADFKSEGDKMLMDQVSQIQDPQQKEAIMPSIRNFIDGLEEDRKSLFIGDFIRSLIFVLIAAVTLWLFMKKKIKVTIALLVIVLFSMIDLLFIDSKYLNSSNYQDPTEYEQNFSASPVNLEILKDTTTYRVFDISNGVETAFNGNALTSVFHHSIGGYHAAKLSIYQDLIEKQLYKFPNCTPAIDMLNTKYIIFRDPKTNQVTYQLNPNAAGACWLVDNVSTIKDPAKVMSSLDSLKIRTEAVIETELTTKVGPNIIGDSIWVLNNNNDGINYQSNTSGNRFAVFSEVYYKKGWKAYIDGKETNIYKTNYVLRGIIIPAGKHEIKFEFKPTSYATGVPIAITASGIIWLLMITNLVLAIKKRK
jgi:hypothetical protein